MMAALANIERRGRSGIWYFRRVVPAELQRLGACAELRISLKTNAWEKAIRAARHLNAALDLIFDKARTKAAMLTQDELNEFMREMLTHELAAFEGLRPLLNAKTDEELEGQAGINEIAADMWRDHLRQDDIEAIAQLAFSEAERQHRKVNPESMEFHQIARAALRVMEQVELATAKRLRGQYDDDEHYRALGLPSPRMTAPAESKKGPPPAARRPLSEVYRECRAYQVDHREWTESTARSKDISIRYFQEAVGDLRFDRITADDVATFDRALRRQPANMGRGIYADLSLLQAIERFEEELAKVEAERAAGRISAAEADKRLREPWAKRSEPNNQTKHINALSAVITWANEVMRWGIPNYCDGFRLSRKARKKLSKKRKALSVDWIQRLLLTPMFTGHSPRRKSHPGPAVAKDGDYWSVLIAVFQGCRLDEGAKLTPDDITREHGIWCMRLNHDDSDAGTGKTGASRRKVPMHSVLIKLGLVDHAKRMRKKGAEWLFPEMTISKHHGSRASNLTKRLLTYKRTMGLYERWKDQHAFRHTMNSRLLRAGVPIPVAKELLGWSREGMSEDEYFTPSTIAELRDALEKYDLGIDLEQRRGEWQIIGAHPIPDPGASVAAKKKTKTRNEKATDHFRKRSRGFVAAQR